MKTTFIFTLTARCLERGCVWNAEGDSVIDAMREHQRETHHQAVASGSRIRRRKEVVRLAQSPALRIGT